MLGIEPRPPDPKSGALPLSHTLTSSQHSYQFFHLASLHVMFLCSPSIWPALLDMVLLSLLPVWPNRESHLSIDTPVILPSIWPALLTMLCSWVSWPNLESHFFWSIFCRYPPFHLASLHVMFLSSFHLACIANHVMLLGIVAQS